MPKDEPECNLVILGSHQTPLGGPLKGEKWRDALGFNRGSPHHKEVFKEGNIELWNYKKQKKDFRYWTLYDEERAKFVLKGFF